MKTFDINPNCGPDEINQYKVKGVDLVMDLMTMLDILEPMKHVMTAVQAVNLAPWKAAAYCKTPEALQEDEFCPPHPHS